MTRIYDNLPTHDIIDLGFEAWRIDSIDETDSFIFYLDDLIFSFKGTRFSGSRNWCGAGFQDDLTLYYYIKFFHNESSLNLTFRNGFNQAPTDESFGYRGIKIQMRNRTDKEDREIIYAVGPNPPQNLSMMTCGIGQSVIDPFYGCSNCVRGCRWCDGVNVQNCSYCDVNSSAKDLFWCENCLISSGNYCTHCSLPYYLNVFNGTCDTSCRFTQKTNSTGRYCYFPCEDDEFLLENGTCTKNCPSSTFNKEFYPGVRLCYFRCTSSKSMYLNLTCTKSCEFPYEITQIGIERYCKFICPTNNYLSDRSCVESCGRFEYPITLTYNNETFCFESEQDPLLKALFAVIQGVVTASFASSAPLILVGVNPSIVASLVAMLQMFYYLLFFNVNYPDNVKRILILFSIGKFDFLPNPLEWVEFDFEPLPSPKNFNENGYSGLMFQSGGAILFGYFILLTTDLVTLVFARHFNFLSLFKRMSIYLSNKIKANGYIWLILATFPDMMFCSLLQIINLNFTDYLYSASSTISLIVLFTNLLFLIFSYQVLSRKSIDHKHLENFEALYEDFDITKDFVKLFAFSRLLEKTIYCFAIVIFYYMPFYQVGIPLILNIIMIYLLMKYKPHHESAKNHHEIILEISYLCLHSCILALGIDDQQLALSNRVRENVGWCMIGIIALNVLITVISVIIEEYHAVIDFLRVVKKFSNNLFKNPKKLTKRPIESNVNISMKTGKDVDKPNNADKFRKVAFVINSLRASMPQPLPKNPTIIKIEDDSEQSESSGEEELSMRDINDSQTAMNFSQPKESQ